MLCEYVPAADGIPDGNIICLGDCSRATWQRVFGKQDDAAMQED